MSILKSTNSSIYQPITYDYLEQQGYLVSDTHAIKIGSNGYKYELYKSVGEIFYKTDLVRLVEDFNISYYVLREYYTFFIKTIKDLKAIERYWYNPSSKALNYLIQTIENTCITTYMS